MKKWQPNKTQKEDFKNQMLEIKEFLNANPQISKSRRGDSYYFTIDGINYRVSNHSIAKSDEGMLYIDALGEEISRDSYHKDYNIIDILASKTRIIEIYNNLKNGLKLDKRGRVITKK